MDELTLSGLHDDGEHLVLDGPEGARFLLRVDEMLRAAVRKERPRIEQLRAEIDGVLSAKEIQARIRSGLSAEDLAEASGLPLAHIQRYEGPVLAEREYVAQRAVSSRLTHEQGAPELGDLVTDRLAGRGVDPESLRWDSFRSGERGWIVRLDFTVGDLEREATWSFDPQTRSLHAEDDEAKWLSETELHDEPIPRRHLIAVRDVVYDIEADGGVRVAEEEQAAGTGAQSTESLLDGLRERRGVRQPVDVTDDEATDDEADTDGDGFEGFGPRRVFDFHTPTLPGLEPSAEEMAAVSVWDIPAAHPADSDVEHATDDQVLAVPERPDGAQEPAHDDGAATGHGEPAGQEEVPAPLAQRRGRRNRASVPSWDEIVFGAKQE